MYNCPISNPHLFASDQSSGVSNLGFIDKTKHSHILYYIAVYVCRNPKMLHLSETCIAFEGHVLIALLQPF